MIVVKNKHLVKKKKKNLQDNHTTSQSFLRADSLMMTIDRRKRGRVIYFFSLGSPRSRSTKQFKVKRKNHLIIFFLHQMVSKICARCEMIRIKKKHDVDSSNYELFYLQLVLRFASMCIEHFSD